MAITVSGTYGLQNMPSTATPAFSAYQSSAQTLSSNTNTKIQFQTEEFDTASCFDNTTNYRFTPNVAGYYQFTFGMQVGVSATTIVLTIYKNGSAFKQIGNSSSAAAQLVGTCIIYLNGSSDYVEAYGLAVTGQALGANASTTYFQGALVRAA